MKQLNACELNDSDPNKQTCNADADYYHCSLNTFTVELWRGIQVS